MTKPTPQPHEMRDFPTYSTKQIASAIGINFHTFFKHLRSGRYGFVPERDPKNRAFLITYNQAFWLLRVHKLAKMFVCSLEGAIFIERLMSENLALKKELAKCRKEN